MSGRVVLGRYRVVAPLARGGMGIVYLGRLEGAAGFSKPVVIKTVIPDAKDTRAAQLFVREARILSNLQHPSIVGVLDFGEVDGEYIMVLEYVHGFHLGLWSRYVRDTRGSMPVPLAVEVMLPVLDALEFAHGLTRSDGTPLDIVHRDVSPANILIDQQAHVKLHDFGIARMADDEFKTQDGTFRGTLSFTAPETLEGVAASPRSDLYACGVILYQLVSGTNPFRGEQPSETLHRVMTHVPPRLSTLRSDVGEALDAVVARAMEKDPAKRFASAGELAAALRAARAWPEEEATAELARVIHEDFTSEAMPVALGVDGLQSRDAAWRAAQPPQRATPLHSSRPPARSAYDVPTQTGPAPLGDATVQALPSPELLQLARAATELSPDAGPGSPARPVAAATAERRTYAALPFMAAALVLVVGGGALVWARRAEPPPPPRFLLIEKQSDADPPASVAAAAPSAGPLPSAAAAAASIASAEAKPALASSPQEPRSSGAASGSSLGAAFQRQRGRVEACFRAHAGDAATPQLTLHFQVEPSGSVRSVELAPPTVASSPLGACILGVARATPFPSRDAPVAFSIPITARKTGG